MLAAFVRRSTLTASRSGRSPSPAAPHRHLGQAGASPAIAVDKARECVPTILHRDFRPAPGLVSCSPELDKTRADLSKRPVRARANTWKPLWIVAGSS